jgi:RNA polymerase sigma-70 factor (ECF subfamily)
VAWRSGCIIFVPGRSQKTQPKAATPRLTGGGIQKMNNGQDVEAAIEAVLNGDAAAFAAIVERWQVPLVNLAYRFCRDRERAEDMAQEAFLRVYQRLGTWRRDAAFSTWMFALATNLYRDEIRKYKPPSIPFEDDLAAESSEEDAADEADRRRLVQTALQSLPPRYRDPLLLFYFHEQNVAATAASLRLPEGTVKARLSRGRALLESKLEKWL